MLKIVVVMTGILATIAVLMYATAGLLALIVSAVAVWPFMVGLFAGAQLVLNGDYYTATAVVVAGKLAQVFWTFFQGRSGRRKQVEELEQIQIRHRKEQEHIAAQDRDFDRIRNWDGRSKLKLEVTPLPEGVEHLA